MVLGGGSTYAQFGMVLEYSPSNYTSMLILNDWQMDYLMPIDPAEFSKGDYCIYGNAATLNYNSNYGSGSKASGTNYIVGFDTALRDNLYFHINYDMVPWQTPVEDKKVYFGFNNNSSGYKEFNEDTNSFFEEKMDLNVIYIGFEIKSSFNK